MDAIIKTSEEAIARANAFTRLETVSELAVARSEKVVDDVTPYLGERRIGQTAWVVEYSRSQLRFASAPLSRDRYTRSFVVTLNPSNGRLWSVTSTYVGEVDENMRPMPSSGDATLQLSDEDEVYDSYPAIIPPVDFLSALDRISHSGFGDPFKAKEIHAAFVLHSRSGSEPKPVWAVTLRGLPPYDAHGGDSSAIPVWQRNHMRNVVDAITGEVLFATSSPQPV